MSTFAEHQHPRTPAGAADGGQFATKARGEADVALAEGVDPARHPAVLRARAVLADVTGLHVDAIDAVVSTEHACGFADGTARVQIDAAILDHPANEVASIWMAIDPEGHVQELVPSVSWETDPLPDHEPGFRDGVSTPAPVRRPATDKPSLRALVDRLRWQARVQRALDRSFNTPQALATLTGTYRGTGASTTDILSLRSLVDEDRFAIVVEDRRSGRRGYIDRLTLDVDPHDGHVEAVTIDTLYGPMRAKTGSDDPTVERVAGELNSNLSMALDEPADRWIRSHTLLHQRLAKALATTEAR